MVLNMIAAGVLLLGVVCVLILFGVTSALPVQPQQTQARLKNNAASRTMASTTSANRGNRCSYNRGWARRACAGGRSALRLFPQHMSSSGRLVGRKDASASASSYLLQYLQLREGITPTQLYSTPTTSTHLDAENSSEALVSSRLNAVLAVEQSRVAMVQVIEASWQQVEDDLIRLPSLHKLALVEDLKAATSLLVLATIKRAADLFYSSRLTLQMMLEEADGNHDGNLTYTEWYDWLVSYTPKMQATSGVESNSEENQTLKDLEDMSAKELQSINKDYLQDKASFEHILSEDDIDPLLQGETTQHIDPMVQMLSSVLAHAISSFQIMSQTTADSSILTAAFVSGGMISGVFTNNFNEYTDMMNNRARSVIDDEASVETNIAQSLLSKLSPSARNLALSALSVENTALTSSMADHIEVAGSYQEKNSLGSLSLRRQYQNEEMMMLTDSVAQSADVINSGTASLHRLEVVTTASSKVSSSAHKVGSNNMAMSAEQSWSLTEMVNKNAKIEKEEEILLITATDGEVRITTSTAALRETLPPVDTSSPSDDPISLRDLPSLATTLKTTSEPLAFGDQETVQQFHHFLQEAATIQSSLDDLDDAQSMLMRQLIMKESSTYFSWEESKVILGLAIALRSTRLKFLSDNILTTSAAWKQQVALESLQVFSPLSFQLGLSAHASELEVFSYLHLFPSSFTSFVDWYTLFKPIGKRIIDMFRLDFSHILLPSNPMNVDIAKELVEQIRSQCSHITLQSRLKSTSSAFKKMLKQAKAKDQLFDLLGLRIIVHMKQANASPVDAIKLNVQPDQPKKREKRGNNLLKSEKDDDLEFEIRLDPNKAEGNNQPATTTAAALEAEQVTLMNIRKVISQLAGWEEDTRRFKDYVRNPKPSGYQSLHMSLLHKSSGMRLEIQLRTERMHDMAEVGPASHLRYKALLLPSSLP